MTDIFLKLLRVLKMQPRPRLLESYMGGHVSYEAVEYGIPVMLSRAEIEALLDLLGTTHELHGKDFESLYKTKFGNAPEPKHHNEYENS